MKKILTVLALCVFAAFAGTAATENLLEEAVFQPEKKNFCNAPLFSRAALRRSSQKMQISFFESSLYRPLFFYAADA